MTAKIVTCPVCGARTKIEYGTRLREHHRPSGDLCRNYDLHPAITNPPAWEVLQVAREWKQRNEPKGQ